jgi:hypothetical protein
LGEQIPSGSVIVETSNNTETFYSVAAQAPNHFMVFMVNTGSEPLIVTIEGLPIGTYAHIQTTDAEAEQMLRAYEVPNETVSVQIPGMSVHILTTRVP